MFVALWVANDEGAGIEVAGFEVAGMAADAGVAACLACCIGFAVLCGCGSNTRIRFDVLVLRLMRRAAALHPSFWCERMCISSISLKCVLCVPAWMPRHSYIGMDTRPVSMANSRMAAARCAVNPK